MSSSSTSPDAETARLRRVWDAHAASYDAMMARIDRRFLDASRRWVCSRAVGDVLEVAIGTGWNLPLYPEGVRLTGLEFSRPMLDQARVRAARLGRPVTLIEGDAARLPFADGSFDTVVCTFALCCVLDERTVLAECRRVLRPGGRLLLADHVVSTNWLVRWGQGVLDAATVRSQGEHWRRRPLEHLGGFGFEVVESGRLHAGAVEHVHAERLVDR